ncbi:MAG: ZIP family metal transporter [Patescibacteria group bacterium]
MFILPIALATFVATLLGGLFALRFRDKLHWILGFSAGAVLGLAFFDLLPEALELAGGAYGTSGVFSIVAVGFFTYLLLDRLIFFHADVHEHASEHEAHSHRHRGFLGAGSLAIHSFLDGVAIGVAFQVSTAVGIVVAIAVLVHDFSDGVNTVGLILKNDGNKKQAFWFLLLDAAAPVLGAASTFLFSLSETGVGVILALFAGFFLYIGATDLIPESHHAHPKFMTTAMTLLGALILYIAISLAGV